MYIYSMCNADYVYVHIHVYKCMCCSYKWCLSTRFYLQFSRFLQSMAELGVVKVEETGKGVESITGIDFKHELIKGFSPSLLVTSEEGKHAASATASVTQKVHCEPLCVCCIADTSLVVL